MSEAREYHHGNLRAELLAIARQTVEEQGADSFSLRTAAATAGVNVAAAYRHFESKQDVLATVAAEGFSQLARSMSQRMDKTKGDSKAAFVACGKAYVDFGIKHPNLYRLMFSSAMTPASIRDAGAPSTATGAYEHLRNAVEALVRDGFARAESRHRAEFFAWAQVHGLVCLVNDKRGPELRKSEVVLVAEEHLLLLLKSLCEL